MPRILQISSDRDDQMIAKIKTQKIPRASNTNPPKNPWIKNRPQKKPITNFWALK